MQKEKEMNKTIEFLKVSWKWVFYPIVIFLVLMFIVLFVGHNEGTTWSNGLYGIGGG